MQKDMEWGFSSWGKFDPLLVEWSRSEQEKEKDRAIGGAKHWNDISQIESFAT